MPLANKVSFGVRSAAPSEPSFRIGFLILLDAVLIAFSIASGMLAFSKSWPTEPQESWPRSQGGS